MQHNTIQYSTIKHNNIDHTKRTTLKATISSQNYKKMHNTHYTLLRIKKRVEPKVDGSELKAQGVLNS